ncbi:hypothetical protein [Methylomicrobium album]|uniref:VCBS repeat-containing protein n=1 Tax=Methylomicrobium album BG8 TaxID=686340 RepID=H8GJR6_METAL|nr:hypothetical protein [Methylomicrobium album]EIC31595.1 hypothetical protein Metal_3966 [Methylomicrobium album BG8]
MIVKNSAIQLNSQHHLLKSSQESESLRYWKTPVQAEPNKNERLADMFSPSSSAQTLKIEKQSLDVGGSLDASQSVTLLIVKHMFEAITGLDFKLFSPAELSANIGANVTNIEITTTPPANQPPSAGFGLIYEHRAVYQESESTNFSATGTIQTQDGRSIDFSVALNMSREFRIETNNSIRLGDPEKKIDPLVINFDGNAAQLSQTRFEFDLDANGITEQIAILNPGSGFLALDKNNDGVINNGSELFGPNSDNGFSELAQYDSDGNGFIDEADPIYGSLRIWQRYEDGSQQLIALGDKNIGAIYLGHATTPFQLRTTDNQSLGEVTDTGVYLTEDGKIGTIQQINLSV